MKKLNRKFTVESGHFAGVGDGGSIYKIVNQILTEAEENPDRDVSSIVHRADCSSFDYLSVYGGGAWIEKLDENGEHNDNAYITGGFDIVTHLEEGDDRGDIIYRVHVPALIEAHKRHVKWVQEHKEEKAQAQA